MTYQQRVLWLLAFLFSAVLLALGQSPPTELEGRFVADHAVIELRWHEPDGQSPAFYRVYRKEEGDSSFHLLSSPADKQYDDGQITVPATYAYVVTAVYAGNVESAPTAPVSVTTGSGTGGGDDSGSVAIQFISSPPLFALLNQPYSYDADVATAPPDTGICFSLEEAPSGMTIDPSTGIVAWTPVALGVFEVEIRARLCSGSGEGEAEQKFFLMVASGTPGSIAGAVLDTAGGPVPAVKIELFDVVTGDFILKAFTDSLGHFAFPVVSPGTYFMRADPRQGTFQEQWFDGVARMEDATPVAVQASGTITVTFVLRSETEPLEEVHLSGTVRDTSNSPVPGARVTAFRQEEGDAFDDLFDDSHEEHHRRHREDRSALTDSNGNYLLTLHPGSYSVGAAKTGFAPQFWDHVSSALEATIIDLHRDTANIDFDLLARPSGSGSISGVIRSAFDSSGLEAHVIGFQRDAGGHLTGYTAAGESDSAGHYSLEHLPDGAYIILAQDGHDLIPTFYSLTGGTPLMAAATPVAVAGTPVTGIDIYVQPDSSEGLNEIAGDVSDGSGDGHATTMSIGPVPGAIVTVLDDGAHPVGAAISSADGLYDVPGIGPGSYTVVFQKPGKSSVSLSATVAYANSAPTVTSLNSRLLNSGRSEAVTSFSVRPLWNLVSVPLTVTDYHGSALFPGTVSPAMGYAGGYAASDMLNNGVGYWVKYPSSDARIVTFVGALRTTDTVVVAEGWNLIGSVSSPLQVSGIASVPPGMVTSQFFAYQGSYLQSDVIEPGRGYWVKVSGPGKLILSSAAVAPPGAIHIEPTADAPPAAPGEHASGQGLLPQQYALEQNFPNPFNPTTIVQFDLPVASKITVRLFNVLGEEIVRLVDNRSYDAGRYTERVDGSALPSGVYFYRLEASSISAPATFFTQMKKMLLVK